MNTENNCHSGPDKQKEKRVQHFQNVAPVEINTVIF